MLDSIYHMTLILVKFSFLGEASLDLSTCMAPSMLPEKSVKR